MPYSTQVGRFASSLHLLQEYSMKRVVKKIDRVGGGHEIEVEFQPSLLMSIFGVTNRTFTYRGSGAMWYRLPSKIRVSHWMETFLRKAIENPETRSETLSAQ